MPRMPIDYSHDLERNLLLIRMFGELSDDDLVSYAENAVADELIDAGTNDFIDLSDVTATTASADGVRQLNEILARGGRMRNAGKMAIVGPSDITYGMARMFQAYRDDTPIVVQVFRTSDEGRAWIGLPPE
jgi:hypothetical protein